MPSSKSTATKKTALAPRKLRQRNGIKAPTRFEAFDFINNVKRRTAGPPKYSIVEEEEEDDEEEEEQEEEEEANYEAIDGVEALRRRNMADNRKFLADWGREQGQSSMFPEKKRKPKPLKPKPAPPPPRTMSTRRSQNGAQISGLP